MSRREEEGGRYHCPYCYRGFRDPGAASAHVKSRACREVTIHEVAKEVTEGDPYPHQGEWR